MSTARRVGLARGAGGPVLAAVLVLAGCARTGPLPAAPTGRGGAPPPAAAGQAEPAGATGPATGPSVPEDPSEVMTPEELATIPDPVPGGGAPGESRAQGGQSPGRVATAPDGAPGATATGRGTEPQKAADSSVTAPGGGSGGLSPVGVWRVQIFAAAERAQADRVAREAAERLGVAYVVQQEGGLYKVRLGAFAREVDAQGLRERALRAGFPGAFRVHTEGEASGGSE